MSHMNDKVSHLELGISVLVILVQYRGIDHGRYTRDGAIQTLQIMVERQLMLLLKVYQSNI